MKTTTPTSALNFEAAAPGETRLSDAVALAMQVLNEGPPPEQPADGGKRQSLRIKAARKDEPLAETVARAAFSPVIQSALSCVDVLPSCWDADVNALSNELEQQVAAVNSGDLGRPEAMLMAQAHTLDALFNKMVQRASNSKAIEATEKLLGMAFKAQSQCRTTLQTLIEVKYPRQTTFIKQANVAGQQQVNNGVPPPRARARKAKVIPTNGLLEGGNGKRLDT